MSDVRDFRVALYLGSLTQGQRRLAFPRSYIGRSGPVLWRSWEVLRRRHLRANKVFDCSFREVWLLAKLKMLPQRVLWHRRLP
jgi:hypothetical protein